MHRDGEAHDGGPYAHGTPSNLGTVIASYLVIHVDALRRHPPPPARRDHTDIGWDLDASDQRRLADHRRGTAHRATRLHGGAPPAPARDGGGGAAACAGSAARGCAQSDGGVVCVLNLLILARREREEWPSGEHLRVHLCSAAPASEAAFAQRSWICRTVSVRESRAVWGCGITAPAVVMGDGWRRTDGQIGRLGCGARGRRRGPLGASGCWKAGVMYPSMKGETWEGAQAVEMWL